MAKYRKTYEDLIDDWGTFGDHDGFGTKAWELPVLGGDEFINFDRGAVAGTSAGTGLGVCTRAVGGSDWHCMSDICYRQWQTPS